MRLVGGWLIERFVGAAVRHHGLIFVQCARCFGDDEELVNSSTKDGVVNEAAERETTTHRAFLFRQESSSAKQQ